MRSNEHTNIQVNLNSSNTDGSFTMANSKSISIHNKFHPNVQENKYSRKFSYFIMQFYVVCTHYNHLMEAVLMSTHNIHYCAADRKKKSLNYHRLLADMINPQWLGLPICRTNFHSGSTMYLLSFFFFFFFEVGKWGFGAGGS